ncbi:unnamed protein product [Parnassius apollo]|uniref:(apollo) hypothetical protein n=1 Tax=Parnassius apollo TaxID=110799 RepID=A0A8S3XG41_PARAO|nr:unnamed protein product [Parnassius apollo]
MFCICLDKSCGRAGSGRAQLTGVLRALTSPLDSGPARPAPAPAAQSPQVRRANRTQGKLSARRYECETSVCVYHGDSVSRREYN